MRRLRRMWDRSRATGLRSFRLVRTNAAGRSFTLLGKRFRVKAPALVEGAPMVESGVDEMAAQFAQMLDDVAPGGAQQRLLDHFHAAGFARIEPPVLQPSAIFLDQSGEDLRGRLYLTGESAGEDLCLRPEYTIPVCRTYLASGQAGQRGDFAYLGPVFRFGGEGSGEHVQAGVESFGRTDLEAADAEIMTLALAAAAAGGAPKLDVQMGDAGLFARLLQVLDLSPIWQRRIRRGHIQGRSLDAILTAPTAAQVSDHSGVLAALAGVDRQGARALVQDLLSIAGITSVGGRSVAEIAERFLEQSALQTDGGVSDRARAALTRFLDVAGEPDPCAQALRKLAADLGLDLHEALDSFEARLNFLAARGLDLASVHFATAFGRNLDYYTGFVFEAHDPARPQARPIVAGGRYDKLLRGLGADTDIPAVGAAIWCDRLRAGATL